MVNNIFKRSTRIVGYVCILSLFILIEGCKNDRFFDNKIRKEANEVNKKKYKCAYTDLGLSVNWGDRNLGAPTETDIGYYVSWGDMDYKGKKVYSEESYYSKEKGRFVPKNYNSSEDHILSKKDDIVNQILGGDENGFWRIPTLKEVRELIDNCEWNFDENSKGVIAKSKINNVELFFPYSGYRIENGLMDQGNTVHLWTSEANPGEAETFTEAHSLLAHPHFANVISLDRYLGIPIRPVWEKK